MLNKLIVLSFVLVACSGQATVTTTMAPVNPSFSFNSEPATTVGESTETTAGGAEVPGTTASGSGSGSDDIIAANAAIFVAALEESFVGTSFEGAVLESPEVFLAAGEVICARLDSGEDVDVLLQDYLDGLLSNADGGADTVSENDAVIVAGGVLGTSIELFCPQHRDKLAG